MAEALGQAATQAPQPMHAAASMACSARSLGDGYRVAVRGAAGIGGYVAAGLDDLVKGASVDNEVLDHLEGSGAKGLDIEGVAI